jgi:hypothetical protein
MVAGTGDRLASSRVAERIGISAPDLPVGTAQMPPAVFFDEPPHRSCEAAAFSPTIAITDH